MPQRILAANWKMHKTLTESQVFVQQLVELLPGLVKPGAGDIRVMVFPGFVSLSTVVVAARESTIRVGAQDCYVEPSGAFTGEVSVPQLKDAGATAALIGHSERRHKLGDGEELVAAKLKAAVTGGLTSILCVGEVEGERETGASYDVVARQLESALSRLSNANPRTLVIAYEPVWAIGTGNNATISDVDEMARHIREKLIGLLGDAVGREISVLYGGSVKPGTLAGYMSVADISGALVGGASLEVESFAALYREMDVD
jgi:triosephosphate isomerase